MVEKLKEEQTNRDGMEVLKIYRYQADQIAEALRMVIMTWDCDKKISCLDRNVMQAQGMIKNVIDGKPEELVKYM